MESKKVFFVAHFYVLRVLLQVSSRDRTIADLKEKHDKAGFFGQTSVCGVRRLWTKVRLKIFWLKLHNILIPFLSSIQNRHSKCTNSNLFAWFVCEWSYLGELIQFDLRIFFEMKAPTRWSLLKCKLCKSPMNESVKRRKRWIQLPIRWCMD